jgi:hypothetical protein
MTTSNTCLWCGQVFTLRRGSGGSPQRFCSSACRTAFHSACRRWAERVVAAGRLTVAALRGGNAAACTLLSGSGSAPPDPALLTALRALREQGLMRLPAAILPSVAADLVAAGWLDWRRCRQPDALAAAVAALAAAALKAGLRPGAD